MAMSDVIKVEAADIACITDKGVLRTMLLDCLTVSVETIIRIAAIVKRLEELGDDLSDVRLSLLPQIRKVAYGQLLPGLLVAMQGRRTLLKRASAIPIPEQQDIVDGKPLKVMQAGGDHRMVRPLDLSTLEVKQVFGRDCIRDEAEQATWLREDERKVARRESSREDISVDRKRGGIVVDGRFIPAVELAGYLSQLASKR